MPYESSSYNSKEQLPDIAEEKTREIVELLETKGETVGSERPEDLKVANLVYQDSDARVMLYEVRDSKFAWKKFYEDLFFHSWLSIPRTPDYLLQTEGAREPVFTGFRDPSGAVEEYIADL